MNIQWKTYWLLILTLGLGAAIGVMSTHFSHKTGYGGFYKCHKWGGGPQKGCYHNKGFHHSRGGGHHGMKNIKAKHILKKLKHHLDLTPEQIEKVEPVLKDFAERLNGNFSEHRKFIVGIMDEMEIALEPILTPEQIKKLKKKMDKKRMYLGKAK